MDKVKQDIVVTKDSRNGDFKKAEQGTIIELGNVEELTQYNSSGQKHDESGSTSSNWYDGGS